MVLRFRVQGVQEVQRGQGVQEGMMAALTSQGNEEDWLFGKNE